MFLKGKIELKKVEPQAQELKRNKKAQKQGHKKMMRGIVTPSTVPTFVQAMPTMVQVVMTICVLVIVYSVLW